MQTSWVSLLMVVPQLLPWKPGVFLDVCLAQSDSQYCSFSVGSHP